MRSALAIGMTLALGASSYASSHREAPHITEMPKVDATDFYMFQSYEAGVNGMTTVIANYQPLQDAYGGPNYFTMDDEALYEIHIENSGDANEDMTFQFKFSRTTRDLKVDAGGVMTSVPLTNIGAISAGNTASLNTIETYTLDLVTGDRRSGTRASITKAGTSTTVFEKPVDNIGVKSFPGANAYANYAATHIHAISIPGCNGNGRVFVGQRREAFAVNLGEVFDLINTNPLGARNAETNVIRNKNVTSLALEIPTACLTNGGARPNIGGWTTASVRQARLINPSPKFDANPAADKKPTVEGGAWTQVSRLGMPLVNEVVIGLKDKDRFNHSEPNADTQFLSYVTNPSLPELIQILFPAVTAPNAFPRNDLIQVFLTGIPNVNDTGSTAEMLRLNTGIAVTAFGAQNDLGVVGGDNAGFPNGRRPIDDVVDAALRVSMGVLLPAGDAPSGQLGYTDGVQVVPGDLLQTFPYIGTPIPGSQ